MAQYSVRSQRDAKKYVSATLPNAANTVNSNGIDLEATTPFPTHIEARISVVGGTGANNKNINVRLQDSIDDVSGNYANIALLANPVLRNVDANGAGHPASNVNVVLPQNCRRWIRAVALGEANGGDSSDSTFTLELLF